MEWMGETVRSFATEVDGELSKFIEVISSLKSETPDFRPTSVLPAVLDLGAIMNPGRGCVLAKMCLSHR
jgi:hypothetical protein